MCLDAPLVALGWALVIPQAGADDDATVYRLGALFFAVWTIYLGDRILDLSRETISKMTPLRKRFARRHFGLLVTLSATSGAFAALCALKIPNREILRDGGVIALATLLYFLCFRILKRIRGKEAELPWKEIFISLCFTGGVLLGSGWLPQTCFLPTVFLPLGLFSLFLSNCLLISKAESRYDETHDLSAYFAANSNRAPYLIPFLVLVSISCGITLLSLRHHLSFSFSILLSSLGLIILYRLGRKIFPFAQSLGDAVLLLPWLALPFL